jgi:hypothetical protein
MNKARLIFTLDKLKNRLASTFEPDEWTAINEVINLLQEDGLWCPVNQHSEVN